MNIYQQHIISRLKQQPKQGGEGDGDDAEEINKKKETHE
jgi:hypothetical protein